MGACLRRIWNEILWIRDDLSRADDTTLTSNGFFSRWAGFFFPMIIGSPLVSFQPLKTYVHLREVARSV